MEFALRAIIRESNNHHFYLLLGGNIFENFSLSRNRIFVRRVRSEGLHERVSFLGKMEDTPPGFPR